MHSVYIHIPANMPASIYYNNAYSLKTIKQETIPSFWKKEGFHLLITGVIRAAIQECYVYAHINGEPVNKHYNLHLVEGSSYGSFFWVTPKMKIATLPLIHPLSTTYAEAEEGKSATKIIVEGEDETTEYRI